MENNPEVKPPPQDIKRRKFLKLAGAAAGIAAISVVAHKTGVLEKLTPQPSPKIYATENLNSASKVIILVTGFPEGKNQLSQSTGETLDALFQKFTDKDTAVSQIYLGSNLFDLGKASSNLQKVLGEIKNPADLVVFSAGAFFSLSKLPEKYYSQIKSLTFVSPFIGSQSLKNQVFRLPAEILIPTNELFLTSLKPLVDNLQNRNGQESVRVFLGENDNFINSESVNQSFKEVFAEKVPIYNNSHAGHAPKIEKLISYIP